MCNECRQYPCNSRCPNNVEEERECCTECGNVLEKGEEVYVNDDNKIICFECFETMENIEIANFFGFQKEVF